MNYWQLIPRTKSENSGPWDTRSRYEFMSWQISFFPENLQKIFLDEIE